MCSKLTSWVHTDIHWVCSCLFRLRKCRNARMEADLMVRSVSSWITLDNCTQTHTLQLNTLQSVKREGNGPVHHTFLTCFITPLSLQLPPQSLLSAPPPSHHHCTLHCSPSNTLHPTLQGGKADLHSAASLRKEEMNKRKETSCWQSVSAPPGAKITVSKCSWMSKMPQRQ